ncbi:MAG: LuxR C-terminal-related transcriptional regulator [Candidatus Accumulibacter sp.]|nr:LuxR C-terminal-related transcriptional regulator [Accumulibacter sp.]
MNNRGLHGDTPYFSVRLRERLVEAFAARSVVVEAPSGYGKTTAVQDFLRKILPENAVWIRHVCTEASPHAAWRGLCRAVEKIDAPSGQALLRLGLPDEDTLGDAETLLRELETKVPAWLVVDDFHRVADLVPASLWKALLEHDSTLLTVALVTRPSAVELMPYEKSGFVRLDENDLRLSERECGEYFSAARCSLGGKKTREAFDRTGGWMIALALHLRHYRKFGEFAPASDLDGLLRDVVWDRIDDATRDAFLRLSLFDAFSASQAAFLTRRPEFDDKSLRSSLRGAFFRFDPVSRLYYPHSALLAFLRGLFAALPEGARHEMLRAAGDWCAANDEREKAIDFYYRLRDFERILSLDLSGLKDNRLLDIPDPAYVDALRDISAHCDTGMRLRHPLSMIQLTFEFFGQGCLEDFARLHAEMAALVERDAVPGEERDRLRGELLLIEAFTSYNSISAMGKRIRRAAHLIRGETSLISPENSWTFGNTSVLLMYHRDVGNLDGELADMETYAPYYTALARAHGSGGEALMRAEALLCRGEIEDAEIHAFEAESGALAHGQISILIGAELIFGRLAILRGDAKALAAALEEIEIAAQANPQKSNRMEADMARSFLMGVLERPHDMADWLLKGPLSALSQRLFVQAVPYAQICRARGLLLTGEPARLIGEAGAVRRLAEAHPLALLYSRMHAASAYLALGKREKALAEARSALALALPDRLILPLAEGFSLVGDLFEEIAPDFLGQIRALAEALAAGRGAVLQTLYAKDSRFGLTEREFETACLAVEGLSSQEMATRLLVSVNTVKAHLKAAYRKTGARNRQTLYRVLRTED